MHKPPNVAKLKRQSVRKKRALQVVYRQVDDLAVARRNPRLHSPKQIRQIADSIKQFGFNVPVLIDENLQIVAGHGRVAAARSLGLTRVPTIQIDHLTQAQKRAFLLADNRLAENSTWDKTELSIELKEISGLDPDFDLEIIGFDTRDLELIMDLPGEGAPMAEDPPADPDLSKPAICQPGDVWVLGPHRLLCGSALEAGAYKQLLGRRRPALVFTDPPYNVPIDGHATGNGKIRHREFAMASGEMTEVQFTRFLTESLTRISRVVRPGALVYVCMDWRHIWELLCAGRSLFDLKNICVWDKGAGGLGAFYRSQHELVAVFKHGKVQHVNNVELGAHGRTRTNVWRYPGVAAQGAKGRKFLAMHPTVKPLALVSDAIKDASRPGDLVLDPFGGSGTTLMAAQETGREAALIEIDPHYCDVIIDRWQAETGQIAINQATGAPFSKPKRNDVAAGSQCGSTAPRGRKTQAESYVKTRTAGLTKSRRKNRTGALL